jgi:hypothetical protein
VGAEGRTLKGLHHDGQSLAVGLAFHSTPVDTDGFDRSRRKEMLSSSCDTIFRQRPAPSIPERLAKA